MNVKGVKFDEKNNMRSRKGKLEKRARCEIGAREKMQEPCGSLWRPPVFPSLAGCSSCPSLPPRQRRRRSRRTAGGRKLSCSGWRMGRRMGRRGGGQSPSSSHFPPSLHGFCSPLAAQCSVVSHGGCPLPSASERIHKNQQQVKHVSTCVISVTG